MFSTPLLAFSKLHTAGDASSSKHTLDTVDQWSGGLSAAKRLLKLNRAYMNRFKHSKCVAMLSDAVQISGFLSDKGISQSASFSLFMLRQHFFDVAEK